MPFSPTDIPWDLIDQMVCDATGHPLSELQRLILQECWGKGKKTYEAIATENNYSNNYIQQRVAPALWHALSEAMGTRVTKSTFKRMLLKHLEHHNNEAATDQATETDHANKTDVNKDVNTTQVDESAANESAPNVAISLADNLEPVVNEHLLSTEPETTGPETTGFETTGPETTGFETTAGNDAQVGWAIEATEKKNRPMSFDLPGGSVPLESPFYVPREPYESRCYEVIRRPGALIRIKAPRQMGKTSLVRRVIATDADYLTVVLSFQQGDRNTLSDLDKFLRWFCANLAMQLKLPPALDQFWDEEVGSKMSCTLYLEDYILKAVDKPLILAIDEASELFNYAEVGQEFFMMLRTWHESAKYDAPWQNLRLILVQSTENYIPLSVNHSPFNVGLEVVLHPLSYEQVMFMVHQYGLSLDNDASHHLFKLVAGHPYLIRLALYHLAVGTVTWAQLLAKASTDEGIFSDHLHRHLGNLRQYRELGMSFQKVVAQDEAIMIAQVAAFKLHSMGLVTLEQNKVKTSCELYQAYFRSRLPLELR
ncbi:MAG: AAA-like domain-containing protein [Cyanobacteria bacterium J06621_11]